MKEEYAKGYKQAINDVIGVLNKHDADPNDSTKFTLKCFKDVTKLTEKFDD